MKTSERLQDARDRVARGWIQGAMASPDGYCMLGALEVLRLATPGINLADIYEVRDILRSKIFEMYPGPFDSRGSFSAIACFNDEQGRTQDEVLAVMDKAILSCVERGE